MGRRRREIDVARAEELARKGLSNEQIRHALGLSSGTFYARKRENEEVEEALTRARARTEADVAGKVMAMMDDPDVPPKVRLTAACWWLERRAGWTLASAERNVLEKEAAQAVPISIDVKVDLPRADSPEMEEMRLEWQRQYELDHGLPVTVIPQLAYDKQED